MERSRNRSWLPSSTAGRMAAVMLLLFLLLQAGAGVRMWLRDPPPSVLIVTLDTTRTDRLGCYGYTAAETPVLDALARKGMLFERAYSPAPLTLPAHATFLTGLEPPEHGLRTNGQGRLPAGIPTLAERLKAEGYSTAAFVASFVLDSKFGLDRGFDVYGDDLRGSEPTQDSLHRQRSGDLVVDEALEWLAGVPSRPFFCWVHLYDPHFPYLEHRDTFGGKFAGRPYDAEIAFTDRQVGRLLRFLEERGHSGRTIVIIAGDHGEGLGDHVELTHGYTLYNETQQVPLLLYNPQSPGTGSRIGQAVALSDVAPTVLDLLQLELLKGASGRSLVPLMRGEPFELIPCYSATDDPFLQNGWSPLRSLTTEKWKYIRTSRRELYDLMADPQEQHNLADELPDVIRAMEARLMEFEQRMTRRGAEQIQLSEAERRTLESLGYTGGGAAGSTSDTGEFAGLADLPDVKDMLPLDVRTRQAVELMQQGKIEQAIEDLRQVTRASSKHYSSRIFLGEALERQGRIDEAIEQYRSVIEARPTALDPRLNLGKAALQQGNLQVALQEFRDAVSLNPDAPAAHFYFGRALALEGQFDAAMTEYRRTLALDPAFADAHLELGNLWAARGRPDEAMSEFRAELQQNPRSVEALINLGVLLNRNGQVMEAEGRFESAVEVAPENPTAHQYLGILLLEQGRYDEAVKALAEARRLAPDDLRIRDQLEEARLRGGGSR